MVSLFSIPAVHSERFLKSAFIPARATFCGCFTIRILLANLSLELYSFNRPVSIAPGSKQVTLTPVGFNSVLRAREKFRMKDYVGPYNDMVG